MKSETIEHFFAHKAMLNEDCVKITFKKREPVFGLFLKDADYSYLKAKNFWRIIPQSQVNDYKASKNASLARIFSGGDFSKLAIHTESFE